MKKIFFWRGLMPLAVAALLIGFSLPVFTYAGSVKKAVFNQNFSARDIKNISVSVEKEKLSESKKKLGTDLLRLIDDGFLLPSQNREQIVSEMKELKQFVSKTDSVKTVDKRITNKTHNDLVYVYVKVDSSAKTSIINSLAWKVTDRDEKNHLAVALVEVDKLEALASLKEVKSIRSVLPPVTRSGSVITEGDLIHQTDNVRSTYSQGGAGIKIGVISNGVDNIASSKSTGDLPADVTVLSNLEGGDEGTAMLEIIHDMVPDANLYFHDAGSNILAFDTAIDNLIAAGVDIIVDDIAWPGQPYFEDGEIASHVSSVLTANNIVYVSSAGNYAGKHYQGNYYNDGINFHDFSSGSQPIFKYLYVDIPPGKSVDVILQWNDTFGSSNNNYNLFLFNYADFSVLGSSTVIQNGDDDPQEVVSYINTTGSTIEAEIDISNYQGSASTRTLEVFILGDGLIHYTNNRTTADSIFGHAAVPGVIAVGAIDANDPGNDEIESFSSQGPITIVGEEQRAKPDIAGIDGVQVTGAGGFSSPFYGTSASAPAVAAIMAQIWGQYPSATADQIKDYILNSAVDLGAAGLDNVFGYGRADALLAYQFALPATHTISGTIKYYDDVKVIPNATVVLEDDLGAQIATTTTDDNGAYQFTDVADGGDYVVRVTKSDNALGLSSADQIKIGRHIVGLELFDTIYKNIAGDVNDSGGLTSADQIKIGRFIVGLDTDLTSGTWKFYSSDVALDTTNYLTSGLSKNYANLTVDMANQDFIGVKMGDVNNSWIN